MNKFLVSIILSGLCCGSTRAQRYQVLHDFVTAPSRPGALIQAPDGNFYGVTGAGGRGQGTIIKTDSSGNLTLLHEFIGAEGQLPTGLVLASDGNFYGTTALGGPAGDGTVFRMSPAGDLTIIYSFKAQPDPAGAEPLIQARDGNLYGVSSNGGDDGVGTVFKITPSGALTILHSFSFETGANPSAPLVQASDGNFYGETESGGSVGDGIVFKITSSGEFTVLYQFSGSDGSRPVGGLVQADDGSFYGTTPNGGANGSGTVFKIDSAGDLTTIYSFVQLLADGAFPSSGVIQGSDGNFYGTTPAVVDYKSDGSSTTVSNGTIFKLTPDGTLTPLYRFSGGDGTGPERLIQGSDGIFYGPTTAGGPSNNGTIFKLTSLASLTTIDVFPQTDGLTPAGGLIRGSDGNFYGTTERGGVNLLGAAYKMTPNGELSVLHSFGGSAAEGSRPYAGLLQASDGNFYGTTAFGGSNNDGTVFRMDLSGNVITLHHFTGSGADGIPNLGDGIGPEAPLMQASDGNLYGTTIGGGPNGAGTIFKLIPPGVFSLFTFFSGQDGWGPRGSLIQGRDGDLYGTTAFGGLTFQGSIFKLSSLGSLFNVYSFSGQPVEGEAPEAGLIQANDGNFYGTTWRGGTSNNGTVFRLDRAGVLTTIYNFGGGNDGANPLTELVQGSDGSLYGTTSEGGTNNKGTVFKVTPSGLLSTLHSFTGGDGLYPDSALIQTSDGSFYGTTAGGGHSDSGVVFRISFPTPVSISKVVSKKVHGSAGEFDIELPVNGPVGIECRSGSATGDYSLVFTFAANLVSVDGASVTDGIGSVVDGAIDSNDSHQFIVDLTGVANAQVITVSLSNVTDVVGSFSDNVSALMGVLVGDVNASGRVDAADVSLVRQQSLQAVNRSNFRQDVNASGRIDAADVSIVRQQSLTSLP